MSRRMFPGRDGASASAGMVWAATGLAWVVAFVSTFLVAPTNTGLDLVSSYVAFQPGSNVGNMVALLAWTAVSAGTGWHFARTTGPVGPRLLAGFGVAATVSLYPSAVVSNAVGHLVAIEDGFVYNDWLAAPLVVAGVVSLVAAGLPALVVRVMRRRPAAA